MIDWPATDTKSAYVLEHMVAYSTEGCCKAASPRKCHTLLHAAAQWSSMVPFSFSPI